MSYGQFSVKLYFHPDVADGLVLEEAPSVRWVVARPLTSDAVSPFDGDPALLQPIAAFGDQEPGQLGVDVVGVAEIGQRAGVSSDTVQKWRERHPDFPGPMATLAAGPVWSWEAVSRWLQIARRAGRPTSDQLVARAWDAVEAALPHGWRAHLVAGSTAMITAEAAGGSVNDRVSVTLGDTASALFALAAAMRAR